MAAVQIILRCSPFERQNNFEGAQYIQDHWAVRDNLTVEVGVRAEWNAIVRNLELAPRFGIAWSPHALGGTKFSAGYGVFYDLDQPGVDRPSSIR